MKTSSSNCDKCTHEDIHFKNMLDQDLDNQIATLNSLTIQDHAMLDTYVLYKIRRNSCQIYKH